MGRENQHLQNVADCPALYDYVGFFGGLVVHALGVIGHIFKPRFAHGFFDALQLFERRKRRLVHKDVLARAHAFNPEIRSVGGHGRIGDQLYFGVVQNLRQTFGALGVRKTREKSFDFLRVGIPHPFALRASIFKPLRLRENVPVL